METWAGLGEVGRPFPFRLEFASIHIELLISVLWLGAL